MSSFTSASQHYADYRDMPMVVTKEMAESSAMQRAFQAAIGDYVAAVDAAVPVYEARQLLPNACAVNIIWTVNARSLINFFEQRLCKRNVEEMSTFAQKVWAEVCIHWPELADEVGPTCYMTGKCNQGFMSCGEPVNRYESRG